MAAASGVRFKQIHVLESNRVRRRYIERLVRENALADKIHIIEKSLHELTADDLNGIQVIFGLNLEM